MLMRRDGEGPAATIVRAGPGQPGDTPAHGAAVAGVPPGCGSCLRSLSPTCVTYATYRVVQLSYDDPLAGHRLGRVPNQLGGSGGAGPPAATRAAAGGGGVPARLRHRRPPAAPPPRCTAPGEARAAGRRAVGGLPDRPAAGVPAGDRPAGRRRRGGAAAALRRPVGAAPGAAGRLAG